ncbi:MAG: hypothetical protein L0L93_01230, partial [Brevibacterium sp.]|nr:hypothetical protein [Brevibacterium sp.]
MTTIITAVVVVVTITTGLLAGPEVYTSIAREFPGTPVVIVVAVLRAIHEVFSILTLGALAAVVMFNSRT